MRFVLPVTLGMLGIFWYADFKESTPIIPTEIVAVATSTTERFEEIPAQEDVIEIAPTPPQEEEQVVIETVEIETPLYNYPPMPLDAVNDNVLPALVSILCANSAGSPIGGATGSGVIIDPRGVILTNAHVAQYVLLESHKTYPESCVVRMGSPAKSLYKAKVLALPNSWVELNAQYIKDEVVTGTGEDDWALLFITTRIDGSPLPVSFPFISFDPRQRAANDKNPVIVAAYPAGFLGLATLQRNLWPSSASIVIREVFTFAESTIDVLSLGGSVVAQGGASGGAVVNQWNKLIGIVVTSTLGATTAERDLRAITMAHIDNSLRKHKGMTLLQFLQEGDFQNKVDLFEKYSIPYLLEMYPF
tara:strand:+ start:6959 stop:8041 length:1083 start_codon:yes stop_codon:yes gene_type:complete